MDIMKKQTYPRVQITDQRALKLIHERAARENRSRSNTAATYVLESLSGSKDKVTDGESQQKKHELEDE